MLSISLYPSHDRYSIHFCFLKCCLLVYYTYLYLTLVLEAPMLPYLGVEPNFSVAPVVSQPVRGFEAAAVGLCTHHNLAGLQFFVDICLISF